MCSRRLKRKSTNAPWFPLSPTTILSSLTDKLPMPTPPVLSTANLAVPVRSSSFPSYKTTSFRNCSVTHDDAKRALAIYGPDVAVLKGNMTRESAAPRVTTFDAVQIPAPLLANHRDVTICADLFFVQGLCYFTTISRNIGFQTASTPLPNRSLSTLLTALRDVIRTYTLRGFVIRDVHANHKFECVRDDLRPIELNVVARDSHVGEIERSIRTTIKERLRSCVHGLPYKHLPCILIHSMVSDAVCCLNSFPWQYGVSKTLSPGNIILGTPTLDYNKLRLELGSYVQVFEDCEPSNTPLSHLLGAITLLPTGNTQEDYHFLSLASGSHITIHSWTELPIPDTAIARIEALAVHDNMPLIQDRGLVVEWRHIQHMPDDEYDRDYVPPPTPTTMTR